MFFGLLAAKALIVVLGLVIAFQGYRAARRERSQRMLLVAGGFTLLSVGSVLEGICYDVLHFSTLLSGTIQTGFVGLGMSLIVVSLYAPGTGGRPTETETPETRNRD
ncbi:hypothetical protein EGH21_21105 [Halomicroarcula sp. F13]|uniref:Uncharacterized protein n=1 Tax=Haloarcula rubra TaxID=2487747 RepID=A0AAW4PZ16_9EURY|nr:hypothetical protein [Halomicroarcula rubra]MBX0325527.1 hypothetical protein [Halomicroarcula rubra]